MRSFVAVQILFAVFSQKKGFMSLFVADVLSEKNGKFVSDVFGMDNGQYFWLFVETIVVNL